MTPLLMVTGALLLVSGLVKVRAGSRAGIGVPPLVWLELLSAVASGMLAIAGAAAASTIAWFVPLSVLLVLVSSGVFAARVRAAGLRRAQTEGGRLATYVKYLSHSD